MQKARQTENSTNPWFAIIPGASQISELFTQKLEEVGADVTAGTVSLGLAGGVFSGTGWLALK
jgi:hypothetical protein